MSLKKYQKDKKRMIVHRGKMETEKIKTLMVGFYFLFYFINKILIKKKGAS